MKVLRLQEGEAFVVGDPTSENCVILRTHRKTAIGAHADDNIRVERLVVTLKRLKDSNQEPSRRIKQYLQYVGE